MTDSSPQPKAAPTGLALPAALQDRLRKLGIRDADLAESFIRASGPGGQNVNKVSTAVRLLHRPSGIQVRAEEARSQRDNRILARERLVIQMDERSEKHHQRRAQQRRKKRLAKAKRPRGIKERILRSKKHRSNIKKLRGERF